MLLGVAGSVNNQYTQDDCDAGDEKLLKKCSQKQVFGIFISEALASPSLTYSQIATASGFLASLQYFRENP